MGTVLRTEKGFRAVYRPAEPDVQSDDTFEALSAINLGVEKLIAGNERQYQWQYKRFRRRPKGLVDHYDWSIMPLQDEAGLKR
jgi:KDO2-lipid IV(A) lauroyltransferase